jgi:hypothetical protein
MLLAMVITLSMFALYGCFKKAKLNSGRIHTIYRYSGNHRQREVPLLQLLLWTVITRRRLFPEAVALLIYCSYFRKTLRNALIEDGRKNQREGISMRKENACNVYK